MKNPLIRYTLRYQDDEGDSVTLTSQNEWEEMVRTGAKEILISSPVPNVPIEFLPRNLQPILLSSNFPFSTYFVLDSCLFSKG